MLIRSLLALALASQLAACDLALPTISSLQGLASGSFSRLAPVRIPKASAVIMARAQSQRFKVETPLILGVMAQESGFNATAVSPVGAMGLMQIMPGTVDYINRFSPVRVSSAFNPAQNIAAGTWYLRSQYNRFRGWPESQRWKLALAAYNSGMQRVLNAIDRVREEEGLARSKVTFEDIAASLPRETQRYVPAVLSYEKYYRNWMKKL